MASLNSARMARGCLCKVLLAEITKIGVHSDLQALAGEARCYAVLNNTQTAALALLSDPQARSANAVMMSGGGTGTLPNILGGLGRQCLITGT